MSLAITRHVSQDFTSLATQPSVFLKTLKNPPLFIESKNTFMENQYQSELAYQGNFSTKSGEKSKSITISRFFGILLMIN